MLNAAVRALMIQVGDKSRGLVLELMLTKLRYQTSARDPVRVSFSGGLHTAAAALPSLAPGTSSKTAPRHSNCSCMLRASSAFAEP